MSDSQLLTMTRGDWSGMDGGTNAALAWLAGGGSEYDWCQSDKCQQDMQAAERYRDNLRDALALGLTIGILDKESLTPVQSANLARYMRKLPANSGDAVIVQRADGTIEYWSQSPGRVPGSYAVYVKKVNQAGRTIGYTKVTVDPSGDIVSIKDKF